MPGKHEQPQPTDREAEGTANRPEAPADRNEAEKKGKVPSPRDIADGEATEGGYG